MKKVFLKTALILLPVILVFIAFPVDPRNRYIGLKEDCFNHGIWIYDRMHLNPKPVDVAFIGSSHTVNGINDKMIEENLSPYKLAVANFGYCRLGRNLSYTLIKELIKTKHPKAILVEVLEDEDRYSHPIFPYIAESRDVFAPALLYNRDILADMKETILYKLALIQKRFSSKSDDIPVSSEPFGFASSPDTATAQFLSEIAQKRSRQYAQMPAYERNFYMKYPRSYLQKIGKLCSANEIKLFFLYLPGYGPHPSLPKENETYTRYGEVLIPPDSIISDIYYWKDEDHCNQAGAASLSGWLAGEIAEKLKQN
jgi:hypothetical protein